MSKIKFAFRKIKEFILWIHNEIMYSGAVITYETLKLLKFFITGFVICYFFIEAISNLNVFYGIGSIVLMIFWFDTFLFDYGVKRNFRSLYDYNYQQKEKAGE